LRPLFVSRAAKWFEKTGLMGMAQAGSCEGIVCVSIHQMKYASPCPTASPWLYGKKTRFKPGPYPVKIAYPFTAPAVRPEMMYFCMNMLSRMMGRVMNTAAAIRPPQSTEA